ncbi:MAG: flagella basal body P-ring formation protein FlgA, partial [Bdellovibrionales bacterium]|nr:flagella basal body P-ring formation protein FlgA [Bdellovibrionales bacterium]
NGKKISIVFERGALLATASGIALEDGHRDQTIRVKNDRSRKILRATVVSADEVRITAP